MSSTRIVVRNVGQTVRAPAWLDVLRALRRRLRPRSRTRRHQVAALSDHMLADIGLSGPGYGQPTWDRYIHRQ